MAMAADEYFENQVLTASAERLHLMVVEGALRFARLGLEAMDQKDFSTAHVALDRSQKCVNELLIGLKADVNPELVDKLKSLFVFIHHSLMLADFTHNSQQIRDAIRIIELHRETWLTLMSRLKSELVSSRGSDSDEPAVTSWLT